jgi:polar amino acid transport system substrate-binding protein
MTIRRNLLISFFFICLALSNSQVYAAEKLESVTLQLTWKNQFQFAGYYVAKELGFYNDVGLDVTIKEYESGTDVTQDVLSQKAHFGVGRSALVLESMEGKEVYLLSAIFQHSPLMLLAKKRSDLKQVSDLKGKRIMMTDDVVGKASLTAMLLANGIKSDSYTLQEHTFNTDDLISGKTDAVAAYISNEPHQMEKRGIDYTIFAPKDHRFDFYSDILFTSQKLYNDNPKLVKRFYQASLQGWAYAFSHIDEAVDLILKKYNTQNRRKDALLFEANTLKTLAYDKGVPLGNINKSRIAQIAQVYRLIGLTHQPLKTDNLILEDTPSVALTPEEKAWLDKHPVVRARIGKAPPLHFFDGKSRGISVDYLNLIAKRAGFTVQYVTDIPWSKALEDIKNHETIDLLLTAKVTPERRKYMAFTKDYLLMPWVIFTQKDKSIGSMEDLMDKTVAVERDYVMHKKLAAEYPDMKLLVKGTSQEAIEAVATGEADAYIGNLTTGVYIIRQNNLNNIKVAASTPFGNHDQAMAIRDDWPELAGIIDKGLSAISEKERNEILTRYLGILSIEGSKTAQTNVLTAH